MDEVERKSVMLDILYEDKDILVVVKPAGVESQTSRRLEPDMVSEIKNYLHRKVQETKKLSTGSVSYTHLDVYKRQLLICGNL